MSNRWHTAVSCSGAKHAKNNRLAVVNQTISVNMWRMEVIKSVMKLMHFFFLPNSLQMVSKKIFKQTWKQYLEDFSTLFLKKRRNKNKSAHSFKQENFCDSCSAFVTQPFVASDSKAWKSLKEQMLNTRCSITTVIVSTQLLPSWHKSLFPVNLRSKQQTKVKEKQEHLSWLTTAIRHRHAL